MKDELTKHLKLLNVDVYANPVNEDNVVVLLGRLKPLNDQDVNLKLSEARLLNYLERVLRSFEGSKTVKVRFSRPWVLKDSKLAYTWDFTFRGDLKEALKILEASDIPSNPSVRVADTPIQKLSPKRGKVKAVTVGRLI